MDSADVGDGGDAGAEDPAFPLTESSSYLSLKSFGRR